MKITDLNYVGDAIYFNNMKPVEVVVLATRGNSFDVFRKLDGEKMFIPIGGLYTNDHLTGLVMTGTLSLQNEQTNYYVTDTWSVLRRDVSFEEAKEFVAQMVEKGNRKAEEFIITQVVSRPTSKIKTEIIF